MEWILHRIILTGLLGASLLFVLYKWGVIEYLQVNYGKGFIYKVSRCRFCQGFWISVILSIFGVLFENDILWLFVPFFSVSLIRLID